MTDKNTKENGLQRYTGIKKYGKKGFEELQKAGREGASEKEKGAIKDKYLKKKTNEGLADLAGAAERDHEVQMARAELYKIAKYAIKLHEMLKNVSEEQGLEGWVQSKITKSADYIGSVYHNLDYEMKFGNDGGAAGPEVELKMSEGKAKNPKQQAAIAIAKKKKGIEEDSYKSRLHAQVTEKARSKAQQKFMGMVYAAKKGEPAASPAVAKAAKGMSTKSAKDYAATKHKGKPEHVKKD